jgi:lipopolysaccharide biosynthesis protein
MRFLDFLQKENRKKKIAVAVHFHLYYFDLLDEIIQYLRNIRHPFDLYVTVAHHVDEAHEKLSAHFDHVRVLKVENRGKDLGGLIAALHAFSLDGYDIVLKIHTKKSLNQSSYITSIKNLFGEDVESGAVWRQQLLDTLLGSPEKVDRIIRDFRKHKKTGLVGSKKYLCSAPDINEDLFREVCRRMNVEEKLLFFAGTMFWIRGSLLKELKDSGYSIQDFKPDSNAIEGELEHCLERIFGTLAESRKMKIISIK